MFFSIVILITAIDARIFAQANPECSFITDNYSGQITDNRCAPLTMTMEVRYKFAFPVKPDDIEILFVWNDGTGAETRVPANTSDNVNFSATESHLYQPSDQCTYTAEAYILIDGERCTSSSRQEQTFSAWGRDNQNSGILYINPHEALFCEGEEIVDFTFEDLSMFNCNPGIEPDKPNQMNRWVQFIYGTNSRAGDRIPDVSIKDGGGNVIQMTDGDGDRIRVLDGPIIEIPYPANGPNQTSWRISAPAGAVAGDIFEITMRNWNICNPYDNDPFDGIPPANPTDGDNPPITTTAIIKIITTPPEVNNPSADFCVNDAIVISVSGGNDVKWYTDSLLTNLVQTGSVFDPTQPPVGLDNTVSGNYKYYVTDAIGQCVSEPSQAEIDIYDNPSPPADAGSDQYLCQTFTQLEGNVPVIGTGVWSTSGGANIDDPADPKTNVTNLDVGLNIFRWTITNGPCVSIDEVRIYRDLQPDPANAGTDQELCNSNSAILDAATPTQNGIGTWRFVQGSGSFANSNDPKTTVNSLTPGKSTLVWELSSANGGCITTYDTISITRDVKPVDANAGDPVELCEIGSLQLSGNFVTNNGKGTWTVHSGGGLITNPNDSTSIVNNLSYGVNELIWTIESQYSICSESIDTLSITRYEDPVKAMTGSDQDLCNTILSAPLGANPPSVGIGHWEIVSKPVLNDPVFTTSENDENTSVQINPGDEGLYQFAWVLENGSCYSSDTLYIDFGKPLPPADAGPDTALCALKVRLQANNPGIGHGTWRVISGPGSLTFSPDIHDPKANIEAPKGMEGIYQLEWTISSGSCPITSANIDTVEIYFKPQPEVPLPIDNFICGPGEIDLFVHKPYNATTSRWYDVQVGSTPLDEDTLFTTPELANTKFYYVSGYNDTALCESNRIKVEAKVHPIPDIPYVNDIQHCGPDTLELIALVGENGTLNRWYSGETGGKMIAGTNNYKAYIQNSRSYWIASYNDSTFCESERAELKITIDSVPKTPIVSDFNHCGPDVLELNGMFGEYGNQLRWWGSDTADVLLTTSLNYITDYLDTNAMYWVTSYNDTTLCESSRRAVKVNIHPIPEPPLVNDTSVCGPDSLLLSASPGKEGTTARWYDMPGEKNIIHSGLTYQTSLINTTKPLWVSSYNAYTDCESSRNMMEVEIKPLPQTSLIQGANRVGLEQQNVIYSVDYHEGSSYNWTSPDSVDLVLENENFIILSYPYIGNFNISVIETGKNGCVGPLREKTILVEKELITLDVNARDTSICTGNELRLQIIPSGGTPSYKFKWEGNSENLNSNSVSNPIFRTDIPGNYELYVTVEDINYIKVFDTLNITVNESPVATILNTDIIVCAGSPLRLKTAVNKGAAPYRTYYWRGNTLGLSSLMEPDPVFQTPVKGEFEMIFNVIDNKGCTGADTILLTNLLPTAKFITDAEPSCSPVEFNFTNQSINAVSYLWDFGDGKTSTEADTSHVFVNKSTSISYYFVNLIATDENQCKDTATNILTIFPNPDQEFTITPDIACDPLQAVLTSKPGGFKYRWDFGDDIVEEGNYTIYHEFRNESEEPLTRNIELISTSFFGCTDTFYNSVLIYPSPKASFVAAPQEQMFPDTTVYLVNVPVSDKWQYSWNFGDGETSNKRNPYEHNYVYPGNYEITLKMEDEHCADSTSVRIAIYPHPPVANFKAVEPGCVPHTVQFENSSQYADSYLWEFGDGAVSNKPNPEYTYYEAGSYKIKLTARSNSGQMDVKTDIGTAYVLPKAFFDLAPKIVYINDEPVYFLNRSEYGDIFEWDLGDGTVTSETDPVHVYTEKGEYDVTLKVWTEDGCYDLYERKNAVIVEESGQIVYPNAIKPYSLIDENRTFKPVILDQVDEYHLMIYNRWGELIFESYDRDIGWDGFYNGKPAKQDVYVWILRGKYNNGKEINLKGDVTVVY